MLQLTQIKIIINLYLLILCLWTKELTTDDTPQEIKYQGVFDYDAYIAKFKSQAGQINTIEMTKYGTSKEICNKKVCKFYIFLYEPQNKTKIKQTIFINSGMHGDQLIGPTSLLYAYPLLKPQNARIIYFPITNPSGYVIKKRQTFPGRLDPNRDYPIDFNADCYQVSATRIIDYIFREYPIDLTINLHNGGDNIAWNWGTKQHIYLSHTEDYPIYKSIGDMLKIVGGYNEKLKINEFVVGTMNQVVYPARGTLDDWAYAGSWSPNAPSCRNYSFMPYPKSMHQGLVFLLELGSKQSGSATYGSSQGLNKASNSLQKSNGYVTRALRMLRELIKVVDPVVRIYYSQEKKLLIKIEGCSGLDNLSIVVSDGKKNVIQQKSMEDINILIENTNSYINLLEIQIDNKQSLIGIFNIDIEYKLTCNKQWIGKGNTFLSRQKIIQNRIILNKNNNINKQMLIQQVNNIYNNNKDKKYQNLSYLLGISCILLIFIVIFYLLKKKESVQFKEQAVQLSKISKNNIGQFSNSVIEPQDSSKFQQQVQQSPPPQKLQSKLENDLTK